MGYADLSREAKQARNRSNAASVARYNAATYSKVSLMIRRDSGTLDEIRAAAAADGQSVNAWILDAVQAKLERQQAEEDAGETEQD